MCKKVTLRKAKGALVGMTVMAPNIISSELHKGSIKIHKIPNKRSFPNIKNLKRRDICYGKNFFRRRGK